MTRSRRIAVGAASYDACGYVLGRALAGNNEAEILTDQGRLNEARHRLDDSLRIFLATDHRLGTAVATSGLARVMLRLGDSPEAKTLLADAREMFTAIGAATFVLDTDLREVEQRLVGGDAVGAMSLARALRTDLRLGVVPILPVTAMRYESLALAALGDRDAAHDLLADAYTAAVAEGAMYEALLVACDLLQCEPSPGRRAGLEAERAGAVDRLGIVELPALSLATVSL